MTEIRINDQIPTDRFVEIDGTRYPIVQGASVSIVHDEGIHDDWNLFRIYNEPPHLEINQHDIGVLEAATLSGQSITLEVQGPINRDALNILLGYEHAPLSDEEWDRMRYDFVSNTETRYPTHAPNSNAVRTTRTRAFVGDACVATISDGFHESQYDHGHWICAYCHFDTCLPGDCSYDQEEGKEAIRRLEEEGLS